jgi:hypothetical protein
MRRNEAKQAQNITDAFARLNRWWAHQAPNQSVIKSSWSKRFWIDRLIRSSPSRRPPNQLVVLGSWRSSLGWPTHSVIPMKIAPNQSVSLERRRRLWVDRLIRSYPCKSSPNQSVVWRGSASQQPNGYSDCTSLTHSVVPPLHDRINRSYA